MGKGYGSLGFSSGVRKGQRRPTSVCLTESGAANVVQCSTPPSEAVEMGKSSWRELGRGRGTQPDRACVHNLIPQIHQVLKSHGQDYLVGNKLSRADIYLVEIFYNVEEIDPSLLANFPLLKVIAFTVFRLGRAHLSPWSLILGLLAWGFDAPHRCRAFVALGSPKFVPRPSCKA